VVAVTDRRKVGVLISGRGSNLAALIEAAAGPDYPAEIACVISSRPNAPGLARASAAGIAALTVDHTRFETREAFEEEITRALEQAGVELVCNAGFMRLLTASFVERWLNRHLNIHPSLLPAYPGLNTHARALNDGARITGCTVHVVREAMDVGPIVAQAAVPVLAGDDADTLAARVLAAEHRLYPFALALFAAGRARVVGERVMLDGAQDGPPTASALFSPVPGEP
jgi:phosphoribosylglycinamide formyltransferase-1